MIWWEFLFCFTNLLINAFLIIFDPNNTTILLPHPQHNIFQPHSRWWRYLHLPCINYNFNNSLFICNRQNWSVNPLYRIISFADLSWAVMSLFLIGKLGITISFAVLYTYTAEMMPTVRVHLIAVCNCNHWIKSSEHLLFRSFAAVVLVPVQRVPDLERCSHHLFHFW